MGVFHRHGALKPTPVPSAMTYFPSGFYLDQTGPRKKRFCLISFSPAIYDIAGELNLSHPPAHWEEHHLEILSMCKVPPGSQREELGSQGATPQWYGQVYITESCPIISEYMCCTI